MQWVEIKIRTKYAVADVVGDVFYSHGVDGLVYEDTTTVIELRHEVSWDYSDIPVVDTELVDVNILAYLPLTDHVLADIEDIRAQIEVLRDAGLDIGSGKITYQILDENDWQHNWKAFFKPLRVGHKLVVCPVWEDHTVYDEDVVVRIDPGLAFGTGSHTTTQHALTLLERYLQPVSKVLDIGCGSGILSIAAAKLGASSVMACDIDDQAVTMTEENIAYNDIPEETITAIKADLLSGLDFKADLVIANITAPILKRLIPDLYSVQDCGGIFICAGILDEYEVIVQKELIANGYIIVDRLIDKDWVGLAARRVD